ncbi:MAG: restriction endonuclease [Planctomycetota bacterium]|nr:MAG: restriction endonuclease [Planctomycetota bacterium]
MGLNLSVMRKGLPRAVEHFWKAREIAVRNQQQRGLADRGNRAGVTAGKNLDGFVQLVRKLIVDNGADESAVFSGRRSYMSIPGFYRPTKSWDLLVVIRGQLVAAVEFKSQIGPSFGNNFNNRVEEALGNATDLLTAYRDGAFADSARPFLGYFFVLEESAESTKPVRFYSPHFGARPEFEDTSYAERYELLCRKLVQERLYDAAALVMTPRPGTRRCEYRSCSKLTSPERFAASLAARIASAVA